MEKKLSIKDVGLLIVGSFLFAASVNIFITPLNLYNGGIVGISQLIRTAIINITGLKVNFDIAGLVNLGFNIPLFLLAYKVMHKKFFLGTLISVITQTLAFSLIPVPVIPIVEDVIASCAAGAILGGIGIGLCLFTGCSGGGMDILSVYAAIKWKKLTVGNVQLAVNTIVYLICACLFSIPTAVYSVIYMLMYTFVLDRMHWQNIDVSCMIFTHDPLVKEHVLYEMGRGVTYWKGVGAYTDTETEVLMIAVSKYEVETLKKKVLAQDPKAFIIINEHSHITGGYEKRLLV